MAGQQPYHTLNPAAATKAVVRKINNPDGTSGFNAGAETGFTTGPLNIGTKGGVMVHIPEGAVKGLVQGYYGSTEQHSSEEDATQSAKQFSKDLKEANTGGFSRSIVNAREITEERRHHGLKMSAEIEKMRQLEQQTLLEDPKPKAQHDAAVIKQQQEETRAARLRRFEQQEATTKFSRKIVFNYEIHVINCQGKNLLTSIKDLLPETIQKNLVNLTLKKEGQEHLKFLSTYTIGYLLHYTTPADVIIGNY